MKQTAPAKQNPRWSNTRIADLMESAIDGKNIPDLAIEYGVCGERVRQIIAKTMRKIEHSDRRTEDVPIGTKHGIRSAREHADFWKRQLQWLRD